MKIEDLKPGRRYWFVTKDERACVISGYYTGRKFAQRAIIVDDNCVEWRVNPAELLEKSPKK